MYIVPMGSLRTLVIHPSTIDVTSNERYLRLIRRLPPLRSVFLLDWLSCQLLVQSSIDPFPDVLTLGIPLCQLEEQFSSSTYGNMHDTMQVLAAIFPHMHTLDVRCPEAYEGSTHAHLQPDEALRRFQMHLLAAAPRTLRRFAYVTEASFARASEDEPFVRVSQLADEIQ
ncbi:hypothetical protein EXIGLDRAFT_729684 [Exidia glandulosa HHB12029]|uniref:Uncharacterized protein n=1 Tax=Exidia glandulosa HHB12029 TaxID=1314781 RepID=A0A165CHE3_EXIGL|nr:hypothetical protein EXIGLDRAFT_729684 [Exidia glandulosa HHB12029]